MDQIVNDRVLKLCFVCVVLAGCTKVYSAKISVPQTAGDQTQSTIEHCLASLGFTKQPPLEPRLLEAMPQHLSKWHFVRETDRGSIPDLGAWLGLGDGGLVVDFDPGTSGATTETSLMARALERCMRTHDSDAQLTLDSQWFVDLR